MNEQKYIINTLANVKQVRVKLKQMQDAYNMLTSELQEKNREREENAKKLLDWFKTFKSEIIREAEYSKTGKKIEQFKILMWEKSEKELNERIHNQRLNNIMLKNLLKKYEHDLKKKEELAEGLNLIDFEQLKIENQTLNEKIEERNEELHKLKKKIHNAVISITHIKEKLHQVMVNIEVEKEKCDKLEVDKKALQSELAGVKTKKDEKTAEVIKKRKEVGFVNKGSSEREEEYNVDLGLEHR